MPKDPALYSLPEAAEAHWLTAFIKLGFSYNRNDIDVLYEEFLKVADRKKEVEDKDLKELAEKHVVEVA